MTSTTAFAPGSPSLEDSNDGRAWYSVAQQAEVMPINSLSPTVEEVEILVAPPSADRTRLLMWYGWGLLSVYCFLFILGVFGELIYSMCVQYRRDPTAPQQTRRRSPFNLYLIFLMIPDLTMSGFCALTCIGNIIARKFMSEGMCHFQSWYAVFGFAGSAWMNALIAAEVYRMLKHPLTNSGAYQPPTLSKITRDSLTVLIFAAFVASWGLWDVSWLPLKTVLNPSGVACIPSAHTSSPEVGSLRANLFFYGCFVWVLLGGPLAYVAVLCYKIRKHNLLPPRGRQRVLAIFFFRLGVIFLVMWIPSLFMLFIFSHLNIWVEWTGGLWAHLQGFVSAAFILTKMEVFQSLSCCFPPRDVPPTETITQSKSKSKRSSLKSGWISTISGALRESMENHNRTHSSAIPNDLSADPIASPEGEDIFFWSEEEDNGSTVEVGSASSPPGDAMDRCAESDQDWNV